MRSRALTETLPRPDVTVLVEEFRSQSHSIENALGNAASHRLWRVRALGHGGSQSVEMPGQTNVLADAPAMISTPSNSKGPMVDRAMAGITMEVVTDTGVGGVKAAIYGTQVQIKTNGEQVYPEKADTRKKMNDDWSRDWKFRSLYPFVGYVRPGEFWIPGTMPTDVPSQAGDASYFVQTLGGGNVKLNTMHEVMVGNERCPAVITKQWPNGCFEVTAFKSDERGNIKPMQFPTMHRSNIFLSATGQNLEVTETVVTMEVPRANPQGACVFIEGASFQEHLGRASPAASGGMPRRVYIDCPKPKYVAPASKEAIAKGYQQNVLGIMEKEENLTINVTPLIFEHFLSGEVRRGESTGGKLQRSWTLQLGPFATHKLRLEKKSQFIPVLTLYVDDEVLVECNSADLGGDPNRWCCTFKFIGERLMDFNVFEESRNGVPLTSKDRLTQPTAYTHTVQVIYAHQVMDSLTQAQLKIDGMPFEGLPSLVKEHADEQCLSITPSALKLQFGLDIPKKVRPEDTRGVAEQVASNFVNTTDWKAIGDDATQNANKALEATQAAALAAQAAAAPVLQDAAANLSALGLSAWEMMFVQKAVDAKRAPAEGSTGCTTTSL